LGQVIASWRASPVNARCSLLEHVARTDPWLMAHHPSAACFYGHVFSVGGVLVCKGCTMTLAGTCVGALSLVAWPWPALVSWFASGVILSVLVLPTLLTSLFSTPEYVRYLARICLGVAIVSAMVLVVVTPHWWVRVVVVATFLVVRIPLSRLRRRKNQKLLRAYQEELLRSLPP
jgi:general stress protein CsbA